MSHLVVVVPILVFFLVAQFFVMKSLYPQELLGDYFIFLSASLCLFLNGLIYYDSYHRLLIFEDYIVLNSPFSFKTEKIFMSDIKEVFNPSGQGSFGTVIVQLNTKKKRTCFFIDNPHEVKYLIEELKNLKSEVEVEAA
mgnify:CR=1 FL=1